MPLHVSNAVLVAVDISPLDFSLANGSTRQFTAAARFSDNTSTDVTAQVSWASSTMTVATVDPTGLADPFNVGLSATFGAFSPSTLLHVTAAVLQSMAITPANPTKALGTMQQFTATGLYSDNTTQDLTQQVVWASGAPLIADFVGAAGVASTRSAGDAPITTSLGPINASTVFHVTNADLVSVAIQPGAPSVAAETSVQLVAT